MVRGPISSGSVLITDHDLSIYLCVALRPLQAWYAISEASNSVLALLRMKKRLGSDELFGLSVRRAYWCCYIIEW